MQFEKEFVPFTLNYLPYLIEQKFGGKWRKSLLKLPVLTYIHNIFTWKTYFWATACTNLHFSKTGKNTPYHNDRFCQVSGGTILMEGTDENLALWKLMKYLGVNDLRARKYPQLNEYIGNL